MAYEKIQEVYKKNLSLLAIATLSVDLLESREDPVRCFRLHLILENTEKRRLGTTLAAQ